MSFRIKWNSSGTTYIKFLGLNDSVNARPGFYPSSNLLYRLYLTDELTGDQYFIQAREISNYVDTYTVLPIITANAEPVDLSNPKIMGQGWFKYELRAPGQVNLKEGMCYVYDDDDNVQNTPDNTTTYEETKDKYVYTR